jgi:hypothetical protein
MMAGGRIFGEEGNVLPSTSSMITGMEMLPRVEESSFFPLKRNPLPRLFSEIAV